MEKELFDYVAERAGILATADTSKQETKDAAAAWKDAVAADSSDAAVEAATTKLLDFLEGRPTTIDGVIAFAPSIAIAPPAPPPPNCLRSSVASSCNTSHVANYASSARALQGPRAFALAHDRRTIGGMHAKARVRNRARDTALLDVGKR